MRSVFACFYQAFPPFNGAGMVTYGVASHAQGKPVLVQTAARAGRERTGDGVLTVSVPDVGGSRWQRTPRLPTRVQRLARAVEAERPGVVVLEGASWVVYHWLLLRRLRQTLPEAMIVYHSHNVEYSLRRQKYGKLVAAITRWAEGSVLREADASFAVSEVDRRQFRELYGVRTHLLPNGVDAKRFAGVGEDKIGAARRQHGLKGQTVLFMGSYHYKPNREGIDFLVRSVMPRVLERCPEAKLLVLGGTVPHDREWLIQPGCVPWEEVPALVRSCQVGVAPIFSGSGTRLKILEYLAAGRPTIATTKGAEGLDIEPGWGMIVADEAGLFASAVASVLADPAYAEAAAQHGQEVVYQRYAWSRIMSAFHQTLRTLRQATGLDTGAK